MGILGRSISKIECKVPGVARLGSPGSLVSVVVVAGDVSGCFSLVGKGAATEWF